MKYKNKVFHNSLIDMLEGVVNYEVFFFWIQGRFHLVSDDLRQDFTLDMRLSGARLQFTLAT